MIDSGGGFQRFRSTSTSRRNKEGFDQDIFFTNEESPGLRVPAGELVAAADRRPGPSRRTASSSRSILTPATTDHLRDGQAQPREQRCDPWVRRAGLRSGDDTFTSGPLTIPRGGPNTDTSAAAQSQLYSYIASEMESCSPTTASWAFVSDDTSFDDYYDFIPGSTQSVSGHYIQVPTNIATGKDVDGSELKAADLDYPLPPTDGSWQRDLRSVASLGIDGPQWVLEYWSQLHNVFDFVRVEDISYDKRAGMGNVVYVVDSGRGTAGVSQAERSTKGRVGRWCWTRMTDPGGLPLHRRRRRRQPGQDLERGPPAGQHRDDQRPASC